LIRNQRLRITGVRCQAASDAARIKVLADGRQMASARVRDGHATLRLRARPRAVVLVAIDADGKELGRRWVKLRV
jgi:hypothetical protein